MNDHTFYYIVSAIELRPKKYIEGENKYDLKIERVNTISQQFMRFR